MNRTLVGLLAASGALMSGVLSLAHRVLFLLILLTFVAASGVGAYLTFTAEKKILECPF